jgi:hypothetical protein
LEEESEEEGEGVLEESEEGEESEGEEGEISATEELALPQPRPAFRSDRCVDASLKRSNQPLAADAPPPPPCPPSCRLSSRAPAASQEDR